MKIVWLPLAREDMEQTYEYYHDVAGPEIAQNQLQKIVHAARIFKEHPYVGVMNEADDEVFEWHIPNTSYTLPYCVVDNEVQILRVFDDRQERPEVWRS
ncbi:type II toxin-antitoxin system RelE/ParE family toxin [Candidatus Gracilibacteria bacterium]|nr:type II toxin-antitoxin system RelE/ParE family toxin [Candidatus Gracilibacteria bacterium]